MAAPRRSLISSLPAVLTMLAGLALLVAAVARWRTSGVMIAIRTPHSPRNRITDRRADGLERALLFGMFLTMMLLPLAHLATGVFGFADYSRGGHDARALRSGL